MVNTSQKFATNEVKAKDRRRMFFRNEYSQILQPANGHFPSTTVAKSKIAKEPSKKKKTTKVIISGGCGTFALADSRNSFREENSQVLSTTLPSTTPHRSEALQPARTKIPPNRQGNKIRVSRQDKLSKGFLNTNERNIAQR